MDYLQLFVDSYKRVLVSDRRDEYFFEAFYRLFISRSPQAAEKFKDTNMRRQQEMLHTSIDHMIYFSTDRRATENLVRVVAVHSRAGIDIEPGLYDGWLDALLEAVRLIDPDYDDDIDLAWRVVLAPGVTYMKRKYDIGDRAPFVCNDFGCIECTERAPPKGTCSCSGYA